MKYYVYVEGQSEALFVADILTKYSSSDYSALGFECYELLAGNERKVDYPKQGYINSTDFYHIVNIGNDNSVVSAILHNAERLHGEGYEVVIGLRDVYSKQYDKLVKRTGIDNALVERMCSNALSFLQENVNVHNWQLRFAVMEYEAWMLAMAESYLIAHECDPSEVEKDLKINFNCDPETTYCRPTKKIEAIFEFMNRKYGKHKHDTHSFLAALNWKDYLELKESDKCKSFNGFLTTLLPSLQ